MSVNVNPYGKIFTQLRERAKYTPDIDDIRNFRHIPLFVYDSLTKGGSDHFEMMHDCPYHGRAYTQTAYYQMKTFSYKDPIVFEVPFEESIRAHVRGELYSVSPDHIMMFDQLNKNGERFLRSRLRVSLEDQTPIDAMYYQAKPWVWALCYIGIQGAFDEKKLQAKHITTYKAGPLIGKPMYECNAHQYGPHYGRSALKNRPLNDDDSWPDNLTDSAAYYQGSQWGYGYGD